MSVIIMEIGKKIRRLRLQRGLTQEELGDRCDLTKGAISLMERDVTSPSITTLEDILECLGTDLATFFSEPDQEKLVYGEGDIFVKESEDGHGVIHWLIPTAQKNAMEPILIELAPGEESDEIEPHDGEEFGYVLLGSIRVVFGDRSERAHRGESFYLKASAPHRIVNVGKNASKVLWISTPPSF